MLVLPLFLLELVHRQQVALLFLPAQNCKGISQVQDRFDLKASKIKNVLTYGKISAANAETDLVPKGHGAYSIKPNQVGGKWDFRNLPRLIGGVQVTLQQGKT